MIVDGRGIANEIYQGIKNTITHMDVTPHLTVFTCAPNFETQKFLALKRKKAQLVGIGVNVIEFPEDISTEDVIQSVLHAAIQTDGIIVQLPFPEHIDIDAVLANIPANLDVDVMNYDGTDVEILPPVVGAVRAIAEQFDILFAATKVVIVGEGRLVGKPAALWARKMGAQVEVVTKETSDAAEKIKSANIIISGAGQPGLLTPEGIADNVLIFDAGTSEDGGELVGDAHPSCTDKAALFTPVPGGIGPITIAILLKNLVSLAQNR